jgi:CubicO group peptidase (beta-lactamase class C family)
MKFTPSPLVILATIAVSCSGAQGHQTASHAAASVQIPAVKPVSTDADLVGDVEDSIERLVRADQFSGVVLLSRRGIPLLRRGYGLADHDAQRANTPETPFALGSVSKMFTAVLIAQLVEQHKVSVNGTIGSLLPDFPAGPAKSQVTIHQLLTMSSGIPDVWRLPQFWTTLPKARMLSDFWSVFGTAPLEFTPGTRWAYSNSNFLVLGAVVERGFGEPFTVAARRVFQLAGMTHTSYQMPGSRAAARGYTHVRPGSPPDAPPVHDRWYPAWDDAAEGADPVVAPMGGGFSTADDLARFADALTQFRLLSAQATEQVMTGHVPADYGGRDGYGLETRVLNGVRIFGHQGGAPGVANQVDFYPDLGYVFVVVGNSDANGAQEIARRARAVISASTSLAKPQ